MNRLIHFQGSAAALGLVLGAASFHAPIRAAHPGPASQPVVVGRGGDDGFVVVEPTGTIHLVFGGKYRSGPAPDQLGPEEPVTTVTPVNGVRIAVDGAHRPHVVFTAGMVGNATRSYYTARVEGRWLPAEKFADAVDFPERDRAYVSDVAVDNEGHALVSFWVSRPKEKRSDYEDWSFHYRWRSPDGTWTEVRSLSAHWSSSPKVEFAPREAGFLLLWQYRANDWRFAGPVKAGSAFTVEQNVASGSATLGQAVQNEGADFSCSPEACWWSRATNGRDLKAL